ncbi:YdcF family protein [Mongoliibacter ruber]|uniref:Uncharacterized SAM-binding protein YcdF (DUF218 family) n=1 Tax=Mongoliibacter ruber TaxID=1750599 RepID=A0A2T0WPE8_9BACT|nr:YdcF family protein [Mongoliibacter ruber]PRY88581.1 uncharacterized SAM-binding protein YcdF (DUF218 family) [Mongoliibacter ruber]
MSTIKKYIKPIIINPDFIISILLFLPLFYFLQNPILIGLIYLLTCVILGPLTFFIINSIENKFDTLDEKGLSNPILVLGGGHTPDLNLPSNQQLTSGALGRVMEGLRVYHMSNSKLFVLSGCSVMPGHPTQAEIQENMLLGIGSIRPNSIIRLDDPTTTEEEAKAFQDIFGDISPILVTKAIHMPRANLTFRNLGITPIPAPCNYIFKENRIAWSKCFIPAFSHAPFLGELLKEVFGIFYLSLRSNPIPKQVLNRV